MIEFSKNKCLSSSFSMAKKPSIFLQHILESIELIEKRMQDATKEDLANNIDLQDMVVRRLEIIGEAVRNLPKEFREKHPEINWKNPADMRSVLIHLYYEVDIDILWDTITKDLPSFKNQIQDLISEGTPDLNS